MTADLKHAAQHVCLDCEEPVDGLKDLSFDIIDPTCKPYYSMNVRIICVTCNRRKGTMTRDEYGAFMADQKAWKERRQTKQERAAARQRRLLSEKDSSLYLQCELLMERIETT